MHQYTKRLMWLARFFTITALCSASDPYFTPGSDGFGQQENRPFTRRLSLLTSSMPRPSTPGLGLGRQDSQTASGQSPSGTNSNYDNGVGLLRTMSPLRNYVQDDSSSSKKNHAGGPPNDGGTFSGIGHVRPVSDGYDIQSDKPKREQTATPRPRLYTRNDRSESNSQQDLGLDLGLGLGRWRQSESNTLQQQQKIGQTPLHHRSPSTSNNPMKHSRHLSTSYGSQSGNTPNPTVKGTTAPQAPKMERKKSIKSFSSAGMIVPSQPTRSHSSSKIVVPNIPPTSGTPVPWSPPNSYGADKIEHRSPVPLASSSSQSNARSYQSMDSLLAGMSFEDSFSTDYVNSTPSKKESFVSMSFEGLDNLYKFELNSVITPRQIFENAFSGAKNRRKVRTAIFSSGNKRANYVVDLDEVIDAKKIRAMRDPITVNFTTAVAVTVQVLSQFGKISDDRSETIVVDRGYQMKKRLSNYSKNTHKAYVFERKKTSLCLADFKEMKFEADLYAEAKSRPPLTLLFVASTSVGFDSSSDGFLCVIYFFHHQPISVLDTFAECRRQLAAFNGALPVRDETHYRYDIQYDANQRRLTRVGRTLREENDKYAAGSVRQLDFTAVAGKFVLAVRQTGCKLFEKTLLVHDFDEMTIDEVLKFVGYPALKYRVKWSYKDVIDKEKGDRTTYGTVGQTIISLMKTAHKAESDKVHVPRAEVSVHTDDD